MKRDSEAALKRSIVQALELKGYWVLRLNAGRTVLAGKDGKRRVIQGVEPGTPDLLVLLDSLREPREVVWLEVKRPKGRLSPKQELWHDKARGLGHCVHVVRSVEEALEAVA